MNKLLSPKTKRKNKKTKREIRKSKKEKLKELNGRRAYRKFNVSGVTFENRQGLLNSIARKYGYEGINQITFIPEPNNDYDPNALKVKFEEVGVIGYVPKGRAVEISDILNRNDYIFKWNIEYYEKSHDEEVTYMEIRLYPKK